jgi:hypothetical protein
MLLRRLFYAAAAMFAASGLAGTFMPRRCAKVYCWCFKQHLDLLSVD